MCDNLKEDLLAALKELVEASAPIASGETPTTEECNRYDDAVDRAKKVIARAER